ncbi:MAG: geranylgeranylglycerol-phosphate geranylgeranyltransferase [Bacteroidota bacterium]
MSQLVSFLKLIRFGNLFIMLATLILARYCLNNYLLLSDLLNLKFLYLIIATLLTGAGGYIINDYYDVKLDLVNKPKKVIVGSSISRRMAMLLHLWFSAGAIMFGMLISIKVAMLITICVFLLWLYSVSFKKQFLIGNIVVAAMSAFVIFILKIYDYNTPSSLILLYSAFAFCISLLREIIKDSEDIKGDSRFDCKTLPIVLGIKKTKKTLITFSIFLILLLSATIVYANNIMSFEQSGTSGFYKIFILLFTVIPLIVLIYLIRNAEVKSDFSRLSLLTKLIMLSGILSMIFLRF